MRWIGNGGEGAVKNKAVVVEYLQFDNTMTNMAIKDKKTARIAAKPLPPPPRRPWGGCGVSALGWFESINGGWLLQCQSVKQVRTWGIYSKKDTINKRKKDAITGRLPTWITQTFKYPRSMFALQFLFFLNTNIRLLPERILYKSGSKDKVQGFLLGMDIIRSYELLNQYINVYYIFF